MFALKDTRTKYYLVESSPSCRIWSPQSLVAKTWDFYEEAETAVEEFGDEATLYSLTIVEV